MTDIRSKLHDLARVNRLGGKDALADVLDEAAEAIELAAGLIGDFPVLILHSPGKPCNIGSADSAEYAHRLGEWMRRRDAFLHGGSKR
ncbi:MAG TPA: hypothetical protein VK181_23250 [Rhizobium sp.]|nr:hypothetical protein [Rhizobium sp.]